ncbi:hypothetical protein PG990_008420 [Apiospora arundinis]|uniref:NAD(P)-binding domain-containing protein n=1 Tax=Apiospora arundinis TaxID=335852 RepID=A0ABR2JPB3_9PEZI
MSTAAVIGCTGQVGSHIISTLLSLDTVKAVHSISRRAPHVSAPKLSANVEADTSRWASTLAAITPPPDVVFSALGTTREQAGSLANQWKIDHDCNIALSLSSHILLFIVALIQHGIVNGMSPAGDRPQLTSYDCTVNIELAKSAHAHGVQSFVFVSCASTQGLLARVMPYLQMKQGVENAIQSLGFAHQAVVLRPGIILSEREREHQGAPLLKSLIRGVGRVSQAWHDNLGQEADVIARAAVKAALLSPEAEAGRASGRYWVIERDDIVRLGRDEWKS